MARAGSRAGANMANSTRERSILPGRDHPSSLVPQPIDRLVDRLYAFVGDAPATFRRSEMIATRSDNGGSDAGPLSPPPPAAATPGGFVIITNASSLVSLGSDHTRFRARTGPSTSTTVRFGTRDVRLRSLARSLARTPKKRVRPSYQREGATRTDLPRLRNSGALMALMAAHLFRSRGGKRGKIAPDDGKSLSRRERRIRRESISHKIGTRNLELSSRLRRTRRIARIKAIAHKMT